MLTWILDVASRFGYPAIFLGVGIESLGIPVPGETTLLVGAFLAGTGRLNLVGVIVVAWLGAVIGDNLGYLAGRRYGRRLQRVALVGRFYTDGRMFAAELLFERNGWIAVFFGRFVALLRIFAGPLAGMHRMPWWKFVIANASGAILWVGLVCAVGVLLGHNLDAADHLISRFGYAGLAVALVAIAAGVVVALRRHRHSHAATQNGEETDPPGAPRAE